MNIFGETLMINAGLSILAAVIFMFFLLSSLTLWIKNRKFATKVKQLELDKLILVEYYGEKSNADLKAEMEMKDDFIKFLSESRGWAFDYIEEVQAGLKVFLEDIRSEIEYFDEYGIVGEAYPHYYSMKKISQAYKLLKNLLPADYGKIDE